MDKSERIEWKFLGKTLFTYDGYDEIEVAFLQFYDAQFPFKSMEKYNGYTATLNLNGTMEVYDDAGEVIWCGLPTEIEGWDKEKINGYPMQENKQRYVTEGKLHKGENRIFVETELDLNGDPRGTWVDELIDNIPENVKVTIIIDYEN